MAKRTQRHTAQANKRSCTWFWAWIGLLALASLVACSPAGPSLEREPTAAEHSGQVVDQGTTKATEPRPKNTPTVAPTVPNPLDSILQAMIERAKADLARQLDVETSQITVVETESVEWRDSSLGCPQPDMMYAQVITPGYRIVFESKGKTYEYHTDQTQAVVLCDQEN